jgi:lipoprotein-releasing system permease protein
LNTAFYIAKRYLFSKKSTNAINIISGISMLGVFVGSAALIIILSAFNGIENLVISMSNTLNPDLVILPAKGKTFNPDLDVLKPLKTDNRLASYSEYLKEKALLRYGNQQYIGEVKGVKPNYSQNKALKNAIIQGDFILEEQGKDYAVIGANVQYTLGVNVNDPLRVLEVYSPNRNAGNSFSPTDEFILRYIAPSGVFESNQESDNQVIIPMRLARELISEPKKITGVEVILKNPAISDQVKQDIEKQLGQDFIIKDRIAQNELLYKILNSEKWAVYLILTFVLVIATFNIVGSLTMLVIDKQKDIAVLNSLGATKNMIRQIFLLEGLMISFIGCIVGLIFGLVFCLLQMEFGFIQMAEGNLMVNAYPIALKLSDFILVFLTVFCISFFASYISSRLSVKRFEQLKQAL